MKRRDFIKALSALSILGSNAPLFAFNRNHEAIKRSKNNWDSDRILILIKLNGGNDGLNTIIPINDGRYYSARPTLAIPPENAITINDDTAFNPNMQALADLFNNDQLAVIQGVGYPNSNLSHFRSSDIWDSGSPADKYWQSGWLGRLFAHEYPNLPDGAPEHPIAIQMGSANILEFQTESTNAASVTFDADWMYWLIKENFIDDTNDSPPSTYGGAELEYVRGLDASTFEYSKEIHDATQAGQNAVTYPETDLSNQLATVAKLISGGLTTPVYRLYLHGFDTHANQSTDHPPLMTELSEAVGKFMEDIALQSNIDAEKVMVVTTSEFGRRVYENGSDGTDHGTSFPIMVFGSGVNSGFFGTHPDLNNLDEDYNLKMQFDFRQIYTTLITDWFGLEKQTADSIFGESFEKINFVKDPLLSTSNDSPSKPKSFKLNPAFPNPFNPVTTIKFTLPRESNLEISVYDLSGVLVYNKKMQNYPSGEHTYKLDGSNWSSGIYIIQLQAIGEILMQKITLVK